MDRNESKKVTNKEEKEKIVVFAHMRNKKNVKKTGNNEATNSQVSARLI